MSCSSKEMEFQRMLPRDCEEQIKMGVSIVLNAYKAKVKGLENDLCLVTEERSTVEDKLNLANQRISKYERERHDFSVLHDRAQALEQKLMERTAEVEDLKAEIRRREADLTMENKRLAEEAAALRKKVHQFESARRMLWETMNNEEIDRVPTGVPANAAAAAAAAAAYVHSSSADRSFIQDIGTPSEGEGRKLFRLAQSRLSSEQFKRFTCCAQRLNSRALSRDDALTEMESICGFDNVDLLNTFRNLIYRRKLVDMGATPCHGVGRPSPRVHVQ